MLSNGATSSQTDRPPDVTGRQGVELLRILSDASRLTFLALLYFPGKILGHARLSAVVMNLEVHHSTACLGFRVTVVSASSFPRSVPV